MYVENGKTEEIYMVCLFANAFQLRSFFFLIQKYFIKIILV